MKKILCVGTATIDIIVVIPNSNVEKMSLSNALSSFLLLEMGRKLEAESVASFYGGGAINAAVSMTRLGLAVDCFVKIGDDDYGAKITQHLADQSIGTAQIVTSHDHQTATSILVSSHDRDPTILTYRGANTCITQDEVPWGAIKNYDAIYITNLSNQSAQIYPSLVDYAHKQGVKVISNPGIRQISNSNEDFLSILSKISMFVINRIEAEELLVLFLENKLVTAVKKPSGDCPAYLRAGKMIVYIKDFLRAMALIGVELCVVTNGKDGAYIYYENDCHHIKSKPVKAIGTVGAGDAFSSTLAALWLRDIEIKKAGYLASLNAVSVVKALDAQSGLLNYTNLMNLDN